MFLTPLLVSAVLMASIPVVDVVGDDSADRYVGTGGLLLPGIFDSATRDSVARCAGCRWRLRDPCGPIAGCLISPMPCPADHRVLETLWSQDGGATWRAIGAWCVGPAGPRTVADVGHGVGEQVSATLQPPQPHVQPNRGIVTQLPTIWHSGQHIPGAPLPLDVLGHRVEVMPIPTWTWNFGDGGTLQTQIAGSRFPDTVVGHIFRRPGRFQVTCTTRWTATFTVDGLGPFPVAQDIEQRETRTVIVREARARLVR